jgi:hypothetical protein
LLELRSEVRFVRVSLVGWCIVLQLDSRHLSAVRKACRPTTRDKDGAAQAAVQVEST